MATPTFKVHRTSEARTSLVDKLIDNGFEVLQTKLGIAITFGDGKQNGIRFTLQTNSIGAQGFGEIAAQSRVAEGMFKALAAILETPTTDAADGNEIGTPANDDLGTK